MVMFASSLLLEVIVLLAVQAPEGASQSSSYNKQESVIQTTRDD
jgi:hypothetical protein